MSSTPDPQPPLDARAAPDGPAALAPSSGRGTPLPQPQPTPSPAASTALEAPAAAAPPAPSETPILSDPPLAECKPFFPPTSQWSQSGTADAGLPSDGPLGTHSNRINDAAWEQQVGSVNANADELCTLSNPIDRSSATVSGDSYFQRLAPMLSSLAPAALQRTVSHPVSGAPSQTQTAVPAHSEGLAQVVLPSHGMQPPSTPIYTSFFQHAQIWPAPATYYYPPRAGHVPLPAAAGSPDRMNVFSAASSSTSSPASAMTPSTSASMLQTPGSIAESPAPRRSRRSLGPTVEAAASGGAGIRARGTFACYFCGISVSRADSLTRHVKRKHPTEVQLAGGNLGMGPLRLPGFSPPRQSPAASTSASVASSPGDTGTGTRSGKRVLCPLCGISLSRTDSLMRHMKKQHGQQQ